MSATSQNLSAVAAILIIEAIKDLKDSVRVHEQDLEKVRGAMSSLEEVAKTLAAHAKVGTVLLSANAVAWMLFEGSQVLLEQDPDKVRVFGAGEWFLPSGKLEGDETEEACLHREIAEEWPGVRVLSAKPLPLIECGRYLVRPFVIDVEGAIPTMTAEGIDLAWFPAREAILESQVQQVRMMVAGGWTI